MARRRLENEPDLDFAYYLADRLKVTVAQIDAMSNSEYIGWYAWHRKRQQAEELEALKAGSGG